MLNDSTIRQGLKKWLCTNPHSLIIEELHIVNSRSIADIVRLGNKLECFEIKSEVDGYSRLNNQIFHYNLIFDRISIVITKRHINGIVKKIPPFWGILLATSELKSIHFQWFRKPKKNPQKDYHLAFLSLWKSELQDIITRNNLKPPKKANRSQLAKIVSSKICNSRASIEISERLEARKSYSN